MNIELGERTFSSMSVKEKSEFENKYFEKFLQDTRQLHNEYK